MLSFMEDKTFFIDTLLDTPDCREIHFFSSVDIDSMLPIMVAMANETGGNIVLGIDSQHKVVGVDDSNNVVDSINKSITHHISPKLPCNVALLQYQQKDVILISVWEGSSKPYLYDRGAYTYVGETIVKADNRLLGLLFDKRAVHDQSWEREKVYSASVEDIDIVRVRSIMDIASDMRPLYKKMTEEQFLEEQGLLSFGIPTNACLLLFAKHPTQFIPQSRIRLSLYAGEGSEKKLVQVQIYEGNLFDNLETITQHVLTTYGTVIKINGITREEQKVLPEVIFREALLNAMVHRDYSVHRSFLNIVANSSNMQIISYGGLLEGLTIPDLSKEHYSILRNPDIANICYLSRLIEIAGSGTLRIIDECRLRPGLTPEWQETDNILVLTLHGISHGQGIDSSSKKIVVASEAQQQVLDMLVSYIQQNPGCKLAQLQEIIGKSLATTKRYIQLLRDNGIIEYQGALKSGGYRLIN